MSDRERHNPELARLLERKVFIEDKLKDIERVKSLREKMVQINANLYALISKNELANPDGVNKVADLEMEKERISIELDAIPLVDEEGSSIINTTVHPSSLYRLSRAYQALYEQTLSALSGMADVYRKESPNEQLSRRYEHEAIELATYKEQLSHITLAIDTIETCQEFEAEAVHAHQFGEQAEGQSDQLHEKIKELKKRLQDITVVLLNSITGDQYELPADNVEMDDLLERRSELEKIIGIIQTDIEKDFFDDDINYTTTVRH